MITNSENKFLIALFSMKVSLNIKKVTNFVPLTLAISYRKATIKSVREKFRISQIHQEAIKVPVQIAKIRQAVRKNNKVLKSATRFVIVIYQLQFLPQP